MTEASEMKEAGMAANTDAINTDPVVLRRLATRAMGMTGADIERIVREARLKPPGEAAASLRGRRGRHSRASAADALRCSLALRHP